MSGRRPGGEGDETVSACFEVAAAGVEVCQLERVWVKDVCEGRSRSRRCSGICVLARAANLAYSV